jgi:hypothetical protein
VMGIGDAAQDVGAGHAAALGTRFLT